MSKVLLPIVFTSWGLFVGHLSGCGNLGPDKCGPQSSKVTEIIDGDTVVIAGDLKVRYLLIDTPEITGGKDDCYGAEARDYNRDLVLDREVELRYDQECRDRFDRLLAYVYIEEREINRLMVERGLACVLYIPPNGDQHYQEYLNLQFLAQQEGRGMWEECEEVSCVE